MSTCPECGAATLRGEPPVCTVCYRLAGITRGTRAAAPLPFADPTLTDLSSTSKANAVASSERGNQVASEAIDGHPGSMWTADGGAPAWWCVDLGDLQCVRGITLVPGMSPAIGRVRHVVETCEAGEEFAVQVTLDQQMTDAAVYCVAFAAPVQARWIRVRTEASTSTVAWREVGVFG
jgi:hypothetical protein